MASLIDRIRSTFSTPAASNDLPASEAAAALLVQLAHVDGAYDRVEKQAIQSVLADVFSLSEAEVSGLTERAETLAHSAVDHYAFTSVAKTLPRDQRIQLVEGLWRVVFADNEESEFEDAFVRRVADLLHVEQRHSRLARKRSQVDSQGD